MPIESGQSVIARVPIDDELQWMLAEVVNFDSTTNQYQIMDLIPDESSKPQFIDATRVKQYPQYLSNIYAGQRLLSIWNDGTSWMSVLYPCQAIESFQQNNDENIVLKVKFDGVPQVQYVNASWVVSVE